MNTLINKTVNFFLSLKLTVVVLALFLVLVFVGTLDQVQLGIYLAQKKYFESFFVHWVLVPGLSIPVFPGGFLLGLLLTLNLTTALIVRFKWAWSNIGLLLSHLGLIIILLGGLVFHFFSIESQLVFEEGQSKQYTESTREVELVLIESSNPKHDTVISIPENIFASQKVIQHHNLPFDLHIKAYYRNAALSMEASGKSHMSTDIPKATRGIGQSMIVTPMRPVFKDDLINNVSVLMEPMQEKKSLGVWLVSRVLGAPQKISSGGKEYEIHIRPKRYYNDFTLNLIDFTHDVYPGTEIPKNFSSLVNIKNRNTGEDREVLIYMNHPLRYEGKTYYQASFGKEDTLSVLQVVENRGWLLPYISCTLISLGLMIHFFIMLAKRTRRNP